MKATIMRKENILGTIAESLSELNSERFIKSVQKALRAKLSPHEIIEKGMRNGMEIIGQRYEHGEYFLTELVLAGHMMKNGIALLEPYLGKGRASYEGNVVIGTVEGDLHDIGKNIVASMLIGSGFNVFDLGVDVPAERFVKMAREADADVVAMSALLTTTMLSMKKVIAALEKEGIRSRVKVIVGGAPVTEDFAKSMGADAYAKDAMDAVKKVRDLVRKLKNS